MARFGFTAHNAVATATPLLNWIDEFIVGFFPSPGEVNRQEATGTSILPAISDSLAKAFGADLIAPSLENSCLFVKRKVLRSHSQGSVGQLSVGWSGGRNAVRASGRLSLPKGEGGVRVY